MELNGLLIGLRRYAFPDKETGEVIRGAKVILGVPPDDRAMKDVTGLVPQDVKLAYADFDEFTLAANSLVGQQVAVTCEVTMRGKFTHVRAIAIKAKK